MNLKIRYVLRGIYDNSISFKWYYIRQIEENGLDRLFDFSNYELVDRSLCTDRIDKNKKEVYEGDIIKWKIPCFMAGEIMENGNIIPDFTCGVGEIKYNSYGFFAIGKDGQIHNVLWDSQMEHAEVIGNIYENPKLLNEDEQ